MAGVKIKRTFQLDRSKMIDGLNNSFHGTCTFTAAISDAIATNDMQFKNGIFQLEREKKWIIE